MVRLSRDRMDMEGGRLDRGTFKRWGEVLVGGASGTNTGSTYTIDLSTANAFNLILNASCAFTFSNPTGSGAACSFTLILRQDGTGGWAATWPAAVIWPENTAPTLTTTANGIDVLNFVTYDGGFNWFGFLAAKNMKPGPFYIPFGYFGGGGTPAVTTVDRIDYSNDTSTAAVKGPLSAARRGLAATGNSSFGYFGGGYATPTPGARSIVDRIDYSNDTANAIAKGPLSSARYYPATTGTSSFGYFGGGENATPTPGARSIVDRIDYSNDTSIAAAKGPLSLARFISAATGTSSFGYFGGGENVTPTIFSTIDRIDYSSDTSTAAVKGPLSAARHGLAATGTSSFGYFGGGTPAVTTVDRIDYSSDTSTAAVKGPLSTARRQLAATGTSSFGYFGGGYATPTPGARSIVDRIDYSNDTANAIAKGPLSSARYDLAATHHSAGLTV